MLLCRASSPGFFLVFPPLFPISTLKGRSFCLFLCPVFYPFPGFHNVGEKFHLVSPSNLPPFFCFLPCGGEKTSLIHLISISFFKRIHS